MQREILFDFSSYSWFTSRSGSTYINPKLNYIAKSDIRACVFGIRMKYLLALIAGKTDIEHQTPDFKVFKNSFEIHC